MVKRWVNCSKGECVSSPVINLDDKLKPPWNTFIRNIKADKIFYHTECCGHFDSIAPRV